MCTKSRLGNGYIYSTGKIEIYLYYLKTNLEIMKKNMEKKVSICYKYHKKGAFWTTENK